MVKLLVLCLVFVSLYPGNLSDRCPHLWTQFEDSCYYLFKEHRDWLQAHLECRLYNAYLVTVNTREENNFLKPIAAKIREYIWIGASDSMLEGDFRWVENNAPLVFTDWEAGEPNNAGVDDNCVMLNAIVPNHWDDHICSQKNYFICELSHDTSVIG